VGYVCSLQVQGQIFWRNLFHCTKDGEAVSKWYLLTVEDCSVARSVSHWLLKLEICVQNQVNCVGFVVDRVAVALVSLITVVLACNYYSVNVGYSFV